jgi:hypothetical protein
MAYEGDAASLKDDPDRLHDLYLGTGLADTPS